MGAPSLWRNRDYLNWWTGTADRLGATVGTLCFAALLVPFAIRNLYSRSLAVLRTPLAEVREIEV